MHPSEDSLSHRNSGVHSTLRRGWWVVSVLLLAAVPVTVLLVSNEAFLPGDLWWYEHVRVTEESPWHRIALICHFVGKIAPISAVAILISLICIIRKHYRSALFTATSIALSLIGMRGLKDLIGRERPSHDLVLQGGYAFPSGHSMATAALATVLVCLIAVHRREYRKAHLTISGIALVATILMMWSRTALHVHWLSDTVTGALLGVAFTLLCARLILQTPHTSVLITPPVPRKIV